MAFDPASLKVASEAALAERIRRERLRRSWSQERLAKEMSVALGMPFAQSSVSKLERGPEGRVISAAELVAFGRVFEVDPLALMLPDNSFDLHQALAALGDLEQAMVEMHHASVAQERARDRLVEAAEAFIKPMRALDEASHRQVLEGLERVGRREDMDLVWATVVGQLHMAIPDLQDLVGPEPMQEALATLKAHRGEATDREQPSD